jgi:hypothetical protein
MFEAGLCLRNAHGEFQVLRGKLRHLDREPDALDVVAISQSALKRLDANG